MHMAKPMIGDEILVKRVLRYLKGNPRSVYEYPYVASPGKLVLYTIVIGADVRRLGGQQVEKYCFMDLTLSLIGPKYSPIPPRVLEKPN